MEKIKDIKLAIAGAVGVLTGLWGWMGWLVLGWIGCMVLDYITGTSAAALRGEWSSTKAREGIWHKVGMVIIVVVAAASDLLIAVVLDHLPVVDLPFAYTGMICPVVLIWYIVTELGSMVENAVHMGAPVPAFLVKLLETSQRAVDAAGDEMEKSLNKEVSGDV